MILENDIFCGDRFADGTRRRRVCWLRLEGCETGVHFSHCFREWSREDMRRRLVFYGIDGASKGTMDFHGNALEIAYKGRTLDRYRCT
jgi:hypothetical protein